MAPGQPGRWPDGTWTDVSDFVVGEELAVRMDAGSTGQSPETRSSTTFILSVWTRERGEVLDNWHLYWPVGG
jgi:hypothetical protein